RFPLWQKYKHAALQAFAPRFAKCGYDALDAVTTITMSVPADDDSVVVIRGLDRDKTMRCFAEVDPDSTTTVAGNVVTWRHASGTVNMMAFANASTMVSLGPKHPTKEALERILKIGAPLRGNAQFLAQANALDRSGAITAVFEAGSKTLQEKAAR